ncbi:MAG: cysteine desulfurase NifS [Candidatus Marinimicrobia bacterium]|nr:cysteine desulfurase NifS [Candidatus Neomarinimicrobiota bacterium]
MNRIFLDYASTTPTDPEVVKVMLPYFTERFGNPSSIYSLGQEARAAIEGTRGKIAVALGAKSKEIIFTSGGTEGNNFAIKGVAYANEHKGNHIITSSVEHHAVIEPCKFLEKRGFIVTYLPVDKDGLVNPDDVRKAITNKTILISIMHANNEVGTIEPIEEIGRIAREHNVYFHTDSVQSFGHIPVDVNDLNVDLLSVSAHKLYGPKGIGALYIRKGTKVIPFMHGGDQERKRRASTENVPGIIGFGKAVEIASTYMNEEAKMLTTLRDKLVKGIFAKIDHIRLNGHPTQRLPNNVNFAFEFVEGESILLSLDMEGIAASTGSACSSSSLEPSHVLLALGLPHEIAHGSLRFTFGRYTKNEDIDYVLEVLPKIVEKLRSMSPLYKKKNKVTNFSSKSAKEN